MTPAGQLARALSPLTDPRDKLVESNAGVDSRSLTDSTVSRQSVTHVTNDIKTIEEIIDLANNEVGDDSDSYIEGNDLECK